MVAYFERSCLIITFNLVLLTPYILDILQKNLSLKAMALRPRIPSLEDVTLIISNLEPKKSSLIYLRRETRV